MTRVRAAFIVLLIIGIVTTGAALVLFSKSLNDIRGDFCTYTAGQYRATLELPQVPARTAAERNDLGLMRQLGCQAPAGKDTAGGH